MADVEIQDGSDDDLDIMDFIETDRNLDEEKALVDPQVQALHDAIEEGHDDQARQMLAHVDAETWVKAQGVDGDTALHLAALYGRGQLVPILLSKVCACLSLLPCSRAGVRTDLRACMSLVRAATRCCAAVSLGV